MKSRQQVAWASGDYSVIGARLLCETLDLRSGEKILNIAAGNATLAAARRLAEVTSTDHVPNFWNAAVNGRWQTA